jgi:hypothetical protein
MLDAGCAKMMNSDIECRGVGGRIEYPESGIQNRVGGRYR